ncbi:unnamed protein product [Litomosoides sigmodontis]|uniref:G-protein coupled receptors family 1 profile domain-containing protein n=1 Tax=Litomosoides sigmodontis TaxID=42156 RepID=A0A3P6U8N9_LITSI|nr:unnamed protein product [Litomosoides sigmodontis]
MYDDELGYERLTDGEYEDIVADFLAPTEFEVFSVFLFLLLMITGVSGNLLVVYVVMRQRKLVRSLMHSFRIAVTKNFVRFHP